MNRFLTIASGLETAGSSKAVIDNSNKFPITGNFIDVTCRIGSFVPGAGAIRRAAIGLQSSFALFQDLEKCNFFFSSTTAHWYIGAGNNHVQLTSCPLGRELQIGDVVTVRLDRVEGQPNINIARWYVNGQKQFETTTIPNVDMMAGIAVFNDAGVTTAMSIDIDYFGVKFVP